MELYNPWSDIFTRENDFYYFWKVWWDYAGYVNVVVLSSAVSQMFQKQKGNRCFKVMNPLTVLLLLKISQVNPRGLFFEAMIMGGVYVNATSIRIIPEGDCISAVVTEIASSCISALLFQWFLSKLMFPFAVY